MKDGVKSLGFDFLEREIGQIEMKFLGGYGYLSEMVKYLLNCKYFWIFFTFPPQRTVVSFLCHSVRFNLSHSVLDYKYFSD